MHPEQAGCAAHQPDVRTCAVINLPPSRPPAVVPPAPEERPVVSGREAYWSSLFRYATFSSVSVERYLMRTGPSTALLPPLAGPASPPPPASWPRSRLQGYEGWQVGGVSSKVDGKEGREQARCRNQTAELKVCVDCKQQGEAEANAHPPIDSKIAIFLVCPSAARRTCHPRAAAGA